MLVINTMPGLFQKENSKVGSIEVDENIPSLLRAKETDEKEKKKKNPDNVDVSALGITSKTEISKTLLRQIVEARLQEIFDLAKNVVSRGGFDLAMPAGIVLTGGTAQLHDISKIAQESFNVPVRVGYPSGLTGMVEEISSPANSAVQGLIKYALEDDFDGGSQTKRSSSNSGNVISKVVNWVKSLLP